MVSKVELKKQYKELIRNKKVIEAQEKLKEIWAARYLKLPPVAKPQLIPQLVKRKYTKEELDKLSFLELRKIGYAIGTKDRNRINLIKEILEKQ